jgi:hypothetical protein
MVKQNIYKPECLIIDGYDFNDTCRDSLVSLRKFMQDQGLKMVWFSAVSHRGDKRVSADGVPAPCHLVDDLFETVLMIKPDDQNMYLDIIKCASCAVKAGLTLALDPSTMLIMKA